MKTAGGVITWTQVPNCDSIVVDFDFNVSFNVSDVTQLNLTFGDNKPGMTISELQANGGWHIRRRYPSGGNKNVSFYAASRSGAVINDYAYFNLNNTARAVDLGADYVYMMGTGYAWLDAGNRPGATYTWSTGERTQSIMARQPGTYWVSVNTGCGEGKDTVEVRQGQSPFQFMTSGRVNCTDATVDLFANIDQGQYPYFEWQVGEEITPMQQHMFTHTPLPSNDYAVTLTATDRNGKRTRIAKSLQFDPRPVLLRRFSTPVIKGSEVTLSYDVNYRWIFWDPMSASLIPGHEPAYKWSTGATTPSINVSQPGKYWVEVQPLAVPGYPCPGNFVVSDTIYVEKAVLNPLVTKQDSAGLTFRFRNNTNRNDYTNLRWSFGDGGYAEGLDVIYTYKRPGKYQVTLNGIDNNKIVDSAVTSVIVGAALPVSLGEDQQLCPGNSLTLTMTNPIPGAKYQWSTGDTTWYLRISQPGTYWLQVTDAVGSVGTDTINITKGCALKADFTFQRANDGKLTMNFKDVTTEVSSTVTSWRWSFGDSTTAAGANVSHTYGRPGIYQVKLVVKDTAVHQVDSVIKNVEIVPLLTVNLGNDTIKFRRQSVRLDAESAINLPLRGAAFRWSTGDTARIITIQTPGIYSLTATLYGRSATDSIEVKDYPPLNIGRDTVFNGTPFTLRINEPFYSDSTIKCIWYPGGVKARSYVVTKPDTYYVYVSKDNYDDADTLVVINNVAPTKDTFNIGRNHDGKLTMNFAVWNSGLYQGTPYWSFGDNSRIDTGGIISHTYAQPGYYNVKMWRTLFPRDTARRTIYIEPFIKVNLGPDITMVNNQPVLLNAWNTVDSMFRNSVEVSWKWSTGETSSAVSLALPGKYSLTATMYGYSSTDTIEILRSPATGSKGDMNYYAAEGDAATIYFENVSTISNITSTTWLFGDGDSSIVNGNTNIKTSHRYRQPGTYSVKMLTMAGGVNYDTLIPVKVWPLLDLGPDTTYYGPIITLKLNAPYYNDPGVNCVWYPGAIRGHELMVQKEGIYYAKVTAAHYSGVDTVHVLKGAFYDNFSYATNDKAYGYNFAPYMPQGENRTVYWNFSDGSPTDSGTFVQHSFPGAGRYWVKMWRGTVTNDTLRRQVEVKSLFRINLGPDIVMTNNQPVTLNAMNAVDTAYRNEYISWKWSTGATSASITATLPGLYVVAGTLSGGYVARDTIQILATPPPAGKPEMLSYAKNGDAATIYFENISKIDNITSTSWWFGDGDSATVNGGAGFIVTHRYKSAGSFGVRMVTKAGGVNYDTTVVIRVWPKLDLGPDTTFYGQAITLKVNEPYYSDPAVQCVWYPGVISGRSLTVTSAGAYYVKVTVPNYVGSDTIVVKRGVTGEDFSFAENDAPPAFSFNFAAQNSSNATWTYWSFGDGSRTDSSHLLITHVFPAPGNYWVKMWRQGSDTTTKPVSVKPVLKVDLGTDIVMTSGGSVTLNVWNAVGDVFRGDPNLRWKWSDGTTETTFTISRPGIYSLTAWRSGTVSTDSIQAKADTSYPKANFYNYRASDGQYTMIFKDTSVSARPITSYQWSFGDGAAASGKYVSHTYASSGYYLVGLQITDANGMTSSFSRQIMIKSFITPNLGPDTTIAGGQQIRLDAGVADADISFRWSTGDTSRAITVTQAGTYWLRAAMFGRVTTDTIVVRSVAPAVPPVVNNNTGSVNVKDSILVTVTFPHSFNRDNVFTIELINGDVVPGARAAGLGVTILNETGSADPRVAVNVKLPDTLACGRNYRIRVVASAPADSTGWSAPFEVRNVPAIPLIAQRGDSLESTPARSYQWYRNGSVIPGATTRTIRAKADGSYYVTVGSGGDCNATSAPLAMIITAVNEAVLTANPLKIFPNPSAGAVYLQLEKQPAKPLYIAVYNHTGLMVHSVLVKDKQTVMDLSRLPKGIYYVQVQGTEKQKAIQVIIQ
ncbi:MAG TPA: PKD domain-containing protein [Chitinophaga sp.]|uniref:PKD domain-containing protein n=1 Tax=Chitinophaga sp. TaxID=1869181 RepID=UPI002C5F1C76|nr:PKD domain-containing protein [Chitinophaga sp.]HVI44319.1 PKD domain-containing protein [Chitinophaga sp.]